MQSVGVAVRYPKKSHRKEVRIPRISEQLAEFIGIMIGDGGINNPWQANVTLNAVADKQYIDVVARYMRQLFMAEPRIMFRKNKQAVVISLASMTVIDFLVSKGLPRGNKLKCGVSIPHWILARKSYKIACVRGLFDTDGCAIAHKHVLRAREYRHVYLSFSSGSTLLLRQVSDILESLGISSRMAPNKREVWIYSRRSVDEYMRVVGSSNERLKDVYTKWRDG